MVNRQHIKTEPQTRQTLTGYQGSPISLSALYFHAHRWHIYPTTSVSQVASFPAKELQ